MRVRLPIERAVDERGGHVLYWMTMYRRPGWNFALERAVRWAQRLKRPLIVLEALRCDYPYASERLHRFVLEGMEDNARAFAGKPVLYYPYIEPEPGAGKGLLAALGRDACVVVTDDFPAFMLPRMTQAAAKQLACRLELVDSNGLLPMHAAPRVFDRAARLPALLAEGASRVAGAHARARPAFERRASPRRGSARSGEPLARRARRPRNARGTATDRPRRASRGRARRT